MFFVIHIFLTSEAAVATISHLTDSQTVSIWKGLHAGAPHSFLRASCRLLVSDGGHGTRVGFPPFHAAGTCRRDGMSDQVWYACFGSNLLQECFLSYIQGGRAPGATLDRVGCTDINPPAHNRGILILHPLYFAAESPQWGNKGVAFLGTVREDEAKTLGRMYLISRQQFMEVVLQENRHRDLEDKSGIDLDGAIQAGWSRNRLGLYDTVLFLGEEEGHPIFTLTASWTLEQAPINSPSPSYLRVIAQGLKEAYRLSDEGIVEYLREAPGVFDYLSEQALTSIVKTVQV